MFFLAIPVAEWVIGAAAGALLGTAVGVVVGGSSESDKRKEEAKQFRQRISELEEEMQKLQQEMGVLRTRSKGAATQIFVLAAELEKARAERDSLLRKLAVIEA